MCDHHGHGDEGHICAGPLGVSQSLDEMEFERGLWGAAKFVSYHQATFAFCNFRNIYQRRLLGSASP